MNLLLFELTGDELADILEADAYVRHKLYKADEALNAGGKFYASVAPGNQARDVVLGSLCAPFNGSADVDEGHPCRARYYAILDDMAQRGDLERFSELVYLWDDYNGTRGHEPVDDDWIDEGVPTLDESDLMDTTAQTA